LSVHNLWINSYLSSEKKRDVKCTFVNYTCNSLIKGSLQVTLTLPWTYFFLDLRLIEPSKEYPVIEVEISLNFFPGDHSTADLYKQFVQTLTKDNSGKDLRISIDDYFHIEDQREWTFFIGKLYLFIIFSEHPLFIWAKLLAKCLLKKVIKFPNLKEKKENLSSFKLSNLSFWIFFFTTLFNCLLQRISSVNYTLIIPMSTGPNMYTVHKTVLYTVHKTTFEMFSNFNFFFPFLNKFCLHNM